MNLDTPITQLTRIGPSTAKKLHRMGIKQVKDLLFHFPARYEDFSNIISISQVTPNAELTVVGAVAKITVMRTPRRRMFIVEALVKDETGSIRAVWFNQPYLAKVMKEGDTIVLSGKTAIEKNSIIFQHPSYQVLKTFDKEQFLHAGRLIPIYPETEGISSRWFRFFIKTLSPLFDKIPDPIPHEILTRQQLPPLAKALRQIHFPDSLELARQAKRRFAFEDLFTLTLAAQRMRRSLQEKKAPAIPFQEETIKKFVASLPFKLTDGQRKAAWEILLDIAKPSPMNRLLEGDVGSGKTVVAAIAALNCMAQRYQVVLMAPTEILAHQHFKTISKILPQKYTLAMVTGSTSQIYSKKLHDFIPISRQKLQKRLLEGTVDIVIGTHALISKKAQKSLVFKNLALAIVDEQHRFGVEQRATLTRNPNNTKTPELPERNEKIIEKELSYQLNGIFFEIQRELGRYGRERQYSDAFEKKLAERGMPFRREQPIDVAGRKSNFADFIVANKILIEVKAKSYIKKEDYYQTLRYLQTSKLELGLIVNFRQDYLKPKRILNPDFSGHSDAFGTSGRVIPHFLSMTATPIPRTLALTVFGDLDISILNELPTGRKKIETKIVMPGERRNVYQFIEEEIKNGRQAFVVCPLIEESEKLQVAAATKEFEKLKTTVFPRLSIGLLHGRMKPKEKQKALEDFKEAKAHILVTTPVVEVGIDVPNASIMMIEGTERFGLAQLHQLRGRVGRAEHQSYCFLLADAPTSRLRAMVNSASGFELAQKDLELRGPGDFYGTRQWGVPDLVMANLSDVTLVQNVRNEALALLKQNRTLAPFPLLRKEVEDIEKNLHLE